MLFKLSTKNIRKSVKDYAIYFVTLVLGISVFYIFNAIETQASFLQLSNNAAEALQLMMSIITGMSVFIAFVLGFLVVYASRFLMKRRNREFALYM
ncbi:MAG: ABC transporter permease, partial [Parasporobacterium sp.]|nr:ABC transporter permease [Parasporobacterium sp.]